MSYNVLGIYENESEQNYQKWFVFDENVYLHEDVDYLPPFQFSIPNTDELTLTTISSVILVNFETKNETEILTEMITNGLEVYREVGVDYDTIIYPSTLALGFVKPLTGEYFLKIYTDNGDRVTEVFCCGDVSDHIKIEYWHGSNFCYPNGHFRYTAPFKMRVYLPTSIGKPSYEYAEKVVSRGGLNFPLQQISFKLNKFVAVLPEFMMDGMRLIRNHDNVEITEGSKVYVVDEFKMENPDWLDRGDLGEVLFEFKTDTVVVTNAKKKP